MELECDHRFGLKKRASGEYYCPLCRKPMYGFNDLLTDWPQPLSEQERDVVGEPSDYDWENPIEDTRQRGVEPNKLNGRGPISRRSREGFKWRKL